MAPSPDVRHYGSPRSHRVRTRYGTRTFYFGRCACGWAGPDHKGSGKAREDLQRHYRQAALDSKPSDR